VGVGVGAGAGAGLGLGPNLVIGRASVALIGHGLGPRLEQPLGASGRVEEGHRAAAVGRVLGLGAGLVGPVVEEGDIAVVVRPAPRHEELGEAVELEVGVEEDHLECAR